MHNLIFGWFKGISRAWLYKEPKSLSYKQMSINAEGRVLDLGSEAMRGLGSIPTGVNILSLDFISRSKASDANIDIIANFV